MKGFVEGSVDAGAVCTPSATKEAADGDPALARGFDFAL